MARPAATVPKREHTCAPRVVTQSRAPLGKRLRTLLLKLRLHGLSRSSAFAARLIRPIRAMDDPEDTTESPSVQDLTPEEASRIISSHRKVRYGKQLFLSCGRREA